MREVFKTRAAEADLDEQWVYLAERSIPAANRIIRKITAQCDELANFPNLGRARPEFAGGLRSLPVDNYVIWYRVLADKIEISRVLHGAADPTQIFAPADSDTPS